MKTYYQIGLSLPGWGYLRGKIRDEAEAGAREGVRKEIPHIRREVRDEATKAVRKEIPHIRREVRDEATKAVRPLILTTGGLSIAAMLISLVKNR